MDEEESPEDELERPSSLKEYFDEMEPYYLSIGMTHEQYWNDEPRLAETYRRAHNMKIEMRNQELWLQGLYIHNAFGVVMANFGKGLSGKKGGRQEKYIEKPIRITPLSDIEKKLKAKEERKKVIQYFTNLQKRFERKEKQNK